MKVNWNALSAISTAGLLVVAILPLIQPKIESRYSIALLSLFVGFLLLIVYHQLFRLIRNGPTASRVYIVSWGIKHWIENPETLRLLGHSPDEVEPVSNTIFQLYPTGKSMNLKKA